MLLDFAFGLLSYAFDASRRLRLGFLCLRCYSQVPLGLLMPVMLLAGCAWALMPVVAGCAWASYAFDAIRRLRLGFSCL